MANKIKNKNRNRLKSKTYFKLDKLNKMQEEIDHDKFWIKDALVYNLYVWKEEREKNWKGRRQMRHHS